MKKNILTVILIVVMLLAPMHTHAGQGIDSYTDLDGHWAKDFIASLVAIDVISGYPDDSFRPDNNITVAEFNVLALKGMDIDYRSAASHEAWYMGSINESISRGIIRSGEFRDYDRPIDRGEMARIIVRAMGENPASGSTDFEDDGNIPRSVKGYVKTASNLDIISGYPDGAFGSSRNATRAEASVMIAKMIDLGGDPQEAEISTKPEIGEEQEVKDDSSTESKETSNWQEEEKAIKAAKPEFELKLGQYKDQETGEPLSLEKTLLDEVDGSLAPSGLISERVSGELDDNEIERLKGYLMITEGLGPFKTFGEATENPEYWVELAKSQICSAPPFIAARCNFLTSPDLVWRDGNNDMMVRGILTLQYVSPQNHFHKVGVEPNTTYQVDVDISLTEKYYFETNDYGFYLNFVYYLSSFREVSAN